METLLSRPTIRVKPGRLFIDGRNQNAALDRTFVDINPATNQAITNIAQAGAEDVELAVKAARRAFEHNWGRMPSSERGRLLARLACLLRENAEEVARLESLDVGKPIREARRDVARAAQNFEFFAELADKIGGESYDSEKFLNYTKRDPLGVVTIITPWNFPLMLTSWKVAPVLAAGNTCVVKPASVTPLSVLRMAELGKEAGLPDGVLNVLTGPGSSVGNAMVGHPDVAAVAFIGETTTGAGIMRTAAGSMKRLALELGGKSANIVFDDASLDEAIAGSIKAIYMNQGEMCLAGSRLFVQSGIYDRFIERFIERANSIKVGQPLDEETEMGALVSQEHLLKVRSYIETGLREGATLAAGGTCPTGLEHGNFLRPTVLTNVKNEMTVAREEIFGPVVAVIKFEDEADAIRQANDNMYGLAAGVWTNDLRKAHRVAGSLQAGNIWVNCYFERDLRVPFGGMKMSGIGREGGHYSFDFWQETKNICVAL
ncbi:MAG TPA: aldehyde dehydrogenase [Chloroflexia bacterium]|nr:aldehyde dehydrogenase [Chloroflexia bacterium]